MNNFQREFKITFHNSKPDKLNLGDNLQFLRFGIGIRVMDYFWITGGSIYGSFLGNFMIQYSYELFYLRNSYRWIL